MIVKERMEALIFSPLSRFQSTLRLFGPLRSKYITTKQEVTRDMYNVQRPTSNVQCPMSNVLFSKLDCQTYHAQCQRVVLRRWTLDIGLWTFLSCYTRLLSLHGQTRQTSDSARICTRAGNSLQPRRVAAPAGDSCRPFNWTPGLPSAG